MPSWYNSKLTLLALPSVIFEPRFNGFIRNLVYADGENTVPRRQEMTSRDAKVGDLRGFCGGGSMGVHQVCTRGLRHHVTLIMTNMGVNPFQFVGYVNINVFQVESKADGLTLIDPWRIYDRVLECVQSCERAYESKLT
ncbi:hypothetical protein WN55_10588 [Dufourea novaeangliae]|uniref:Uncharacterized protein n=1 Tax=Dufourea novaeangliae TaxID=178035 RepID=A0A154P497_DUFNO|nr:hypothetical protein WN55_10588 [Dufourea novaeangliae]